MYGLGFLPLAPEHYDFLLVESRRERPAVQAFLAALAEPARARANRRARHDAGLTMSCAHERHRPRGLERRGQDHAAHAA